MVYSNAIGYLYNVYWPGGLIGLNVCMLHVCWSRQSISVNFVGGCISLQAHPYLAKYEFRESQFLAACFHGILLMLPTFEDV